MIAGFPNCISERKKRKPGGKRSESGAGKRRFQNLNFVVQVASVAVHLYLILTAHQRWKAKNTPAQHQVCTYPPPFHYQDNHNVEYPSRSLLLQMSVSKKLRVQTTRRCYSRYSTIRERSISTTKMGTYIAQGA
jgi:hypothetical protein